MGLLPASCFISLFPFPMVAFFRAGAEVFGGAGGCGGEGAGGGCWDILGV